MDGSIKKKLEKRNERIINAVIKKANSICPESIALIGVYGSFYTGDIHDKSDLDLCIVINDDEGWKLSSCFILDDVAFDIYCTPWDALEDMAEYKKPYITKLLDLNVLYIKEKKFLIRYDELKLKAIKRLKEKFSIKDNENAEKLLEEGIKEYANIMLSSEYGECRYKVAGMLYNIEQAIYIYNKKYINTGVKRIPEEISKMENLPEGFIELYKKLIESENIEEMKNISTRLMKSMKDFSSVMRAKVTTKKTITENDIKGSYEEIYSNWKNKMYHAADINDTYLSLNTAASCQEFYDDMYNEYNIKKVDIMKKLKDNNLKEAAKCFDEAMEEYKENYNRLNIDVVKYNDLDEFEENYLQS